MTRRTVGLLVAGVVAALVITGCGLGRPARGTASSSGAGSRASAVGSASATPLRTVVGCEGPGHGGDDQGPAAGRSLRQDRAEGRRRAEDDQVGLVRDLPADPAVGVAPGRRHQRHVEAVTGSS